MDVAAEQQRESNNGQELCERGELRAFTDVGRKLPGRPQYYGITPRHGINSSGAIVCRPRRPFNQELHCHDPVTHEWPAISFNFNYRAFPFIALVVVTGETARHVWMSSPPFSLFFSLPSRCVTYAFVAEKPYPGLVSLYISRREHNAMCAPSSKYICDSRRQLHASILWDPFEGKNKLAL